MPVFSGTMTTHTTKELIYLEAKRETSGIFLSISCPIDHSWIPLCLIMYIKFLHYINFIQKATKNIHSSIIPVYPLNYRE